MRILGVREAIHDATALHLRTPDGLDVLRLGTRVDTGSRGSASNMIVDAMEAGRILAAIDRQKPSIRYWLLYAYGAEPNRNHSAYISHDLYRKLFHNATTRDSKRAKLLRLCGLAVDDMKMRLNNGRKLPVVFISETIGVYESQYRRDYERYLKDAQRVLEVYDGTGLSEVREAIELIRSGKKITPTNTALFVD